MNLTKKLVYLLNFKERKELKKLILIILITALIDMIGVASILPFMAVLSNSSSIENNILLNNLFNFYQILGVANKHQFLMALGISVLVIFVISLFLKAYSLYKQQLFIQMSEFSIGKRLFESYLHQPYSWFLNRHSAELSKSILSEVSLVITGAIQPIIAIIAYSAVTILLLLLLFITNPKLTFVVFFILGITYFLIYKYFRSLLKTIGSERFKLNRLRFTALSDAFSAIKEVKIRGVENIYIDKYSEAARNLAKHITSSVVVGQVPRFVLEVIAFGGMLLIVLYLLNQNKNFNDTIPILSLYAFAGYRLLPAIQNIYSSYTQLRFSKPAVDDLYNDLKSLQTDDNLYVQDIITFEKEIHLFNVNYRYPSSSKEILNNINLKIPANKKIGIIGTTGCGKTTLVDIILGLLPIQDGKLKVDEKVLNGSNIRSWQRNIGYIPQNIHLIDDTISANIAFGMNSSDINLETVEHVCKIAQLEDFIKNQLPLQYQTKVGERGVRLSGGQKQRIGIARALYHKPKLLVFDEATSALDTETESKLMNEIHNYQSNATIIMIAHRLNTLKKCDTIILIEKGKIKAQGSYENLVEGKKL